MRNVFLTFALAGATFLLASASPTRAAQSDEKPIKALLVLGGCCHDYKNQQTILPEGIAARANVEWTIAYDPDNGTKHLNPVYKNPDWYKGFDVIVHDECSADVKDLEMVERILKPHREGLPAVVLHCGMHSYRSEGWPDKDTPWFEFTGLATTGHRALIPIAVRYIDQDSPITRGLHDWTTVKEELYNNVRPPLPTAHPLARGKQEDNDDVCVWTNAYGPKKTKVFATTLGHTNETVGDARYLDLVTRGLLWSVDKLDDKHLKPAKAEPKAEAPAASKNKQVLVASTGSAQPEGCACEDDAK
jgi:type 1 glutamine amidotransferase